MPTSDRPCLISPQRLRQAARILRAGGIVAHATEGVWGLACDPLDGDAVLRLVALKRRDVARGLIVVADQADRLAPFVAPAADAAWQRALDGWPGHNTWLLPVADDVPWWLTGAHDRIALRHSAHVETRALCAAFGGALVSTSANVSGHPPVRSPWQARAAFGAGVDMVAGGRLDNPGVPSTIRDATDNRLVRGA